MSCRSGCPDQNCASYAECLRGANVKVSYTNSANGWDRTKQQKWDKELSDYRDARRQGIEPAGTDRKSIDAAVAISNEIGHPFRA